VPPGIRYLCILAKCNWTSTSVYIFARLGVADVLLCGPREGMAAEDIAEKVTTDEGARCGPCS